MKKIIVAGLLVASLVLVNAGVASAAGPFHGNCCSTTSCPPLVPPCY